MTQAFEDTIAEKVVRGSPMAAVAADMMGKLGRAASLRRRSNTAVGVTLTPSVDVGCSRMDGSSMLRQPPRLRVASGVLAARLEKMHYTILRLRYSHTFDVRRDPEAVRAFPRG